MADHTKRLRHVVIGVGAGVLGMHRPALQLETVDLVGVSDIDTERGRQRAAELNCSFFADYRQMLTQTQPDVAVIMTPHPFHAEIAIDCLEAGCHVLVEKPMAAHVAEADAMVEAAARTGRRLAVNFQQRYRPEVQAARNLIREGQLGIVQYVDMAETWTRTAAYYRAASWRATWAGEGGGVLMNQAPHNLDLLCFLMGLPKRIVAWTRTQFHQIETEDTVQAMLEWEDGALGAVHTSTAEAGQPQRLEILGTRGHLRVDRSESRVVLTQFETDLQNYLVQSPELYRPPAQRLVPVEVGSGTGDHLSIYRNLHEAIVHGTPLIADGVEGCMSLELANAMIYSSYTGKEVALPLDRQAYAALLEDLKIKAQMQGGERGHV